MKPFPSTFFRIFCLFGAMLLLGSFPPQAYALIGNGANAMNVVGQLNNAGAISYLKSSPNSGPNARGFHVPYDVEIDAVNHRLFVSDATQFSNRRVLVFNLDASNQLVDYTADFVLGQLDFDSEAMGNFDPDPAFRTSQRAFLQPSGLAYDPTNQRLFVADFFASRILIFDVNFISNGENAQNVLGQADFIGAGGATSQAGLFFPEDLLYDVARARLFVADARNNRVMVFDMGSVVNGENAVNVLGQANFTNNTAATTQSGLNNPRGLAFDPANQRLFVTDAGNNRVMVFDVNFISNGENAQNVLGQANFTSNASSTTLAGFNFPSYTVYDSGASRLFVSDLLNARIMIFDAASSIVNGQSAMNVLGQMSFPVADTFTATESMTPYGMTLNGSNLFVSDYGHSRLLIFDIAAITDNENPVNALGQLDTSLAPHFTKRGPNNGPFNNGFEQPYDMAIDTANHRLFVSDDRNSRVLVFNLTTSDTLTDYTADFVLGPSDFTTGERLSGSFSLDTSSRSHTLFYPKGLAFDSAGSRLFVADSGNQRVMVFDVAAITNGENAVNVLGQADFTSNAAATSQSGLSTPQGLAYDSANQRLFVSERENNRVMVFNLADGISNGENAVSVLGQTDFTTATSGLSQSKLNYPDGLAYENTNQRLFVSDSSNNRVLVFDVNSIANGENAQNVLGQANFTSNTAVASQSGLYFPRGLAYSNNLSYLLVSDTMHSRVLFFDVSSIANGENAVIVLGQTNFTDASPATSQSRFSFPQGLFLNPANGHLWVADTNSNRVLVFDTQFGPGGAGFTGGSSYQAPKSPDPAPSPDESIPQTPPSSPAPSEPAPQKQALPETFSFKPALPNPFTPQPPAPKPASPKLIPQNLFFFGFPRGK